MQIGPRGGCTMSDQSSVNDEKSVAEFKEYCRQNELRMEPKNRGMTVDEFENEIMAGLEADFEGKPGASVISNK